MFNFSDVQPETSQHDRNGDEADAETDAAIVALHHGLFADFQVRGSNFHARLNVCIHQRWLKRMDRDPRLDERVARLLLGEERRAYFHSGRLSEMQLLVGVRDGMIQSRETRQNSHPLLIALVARFMTVDANACGACAEHGVRWLVDGVIAVTDDAAGEVRLLKCLEM